LTGRIVAERCDWIVCERLRHARPARGDCPPNLWRLVFRAGPDPGRRVVQSARQGVLFRQRPPHKCSFLEWVALEELPDEVVRRN
jgi:hypothetical protein